MIVLQTDNPEAPEQKVRRILGESALRLIVIQCDQLGLDLVQVLKGILSEGEDGDRTKQGRWLVQKQDGTTVSVGGLSQAETRTAFALRENVKALAQTYGLEKLGFLTLTFAEAIRDTKEAQRRFNSLCTNYLRKRFQDWIVVVEPQAQRQGVVHYHLLVACREDIRTGVNWEEIAKGSYRSAGPALRALWKEMRPESQGGQGMLTRYGFGRHELLPIRSTQEGIAKYVGKYIAKGTGQRLGEWEKARLVRYSKRTPWRAASVNFAWNSHGSAEWRKLVSEIAAVLGVEDLAGMKERVGRRWAWHAKQAADNYRLAGAEVVPEAIARQLLWHRWRACPDALAAALRSIERASPDDWEARKVHFEPDAEASDRRGWGGLVAPQMQDRSQEPF